MSSESSGQQILLARYKENSNRTRHHETLRERTTAMVAQTTGILLGLMGFGVSIFLSCSAVLAFNCKGVPEKTATEAIKNYSGVFSGKVVKIKGPKTRKRGNRVEFLGQFIEVTLRVKTSWKMVESEEITIRTPFSDCGYIFEVGEEYLLWVNLSEKDERLITGLCSRTDKLGNSIRDVMELGEGRQLTH